MALTKVTYSMIKGAYINVLDYGADATGTNDSSSAIQSAIDAAAGKYVYVPEGTYRINTQLTYSTTTALSPGLKIVGDGMYKTVFDSRVGNGAMLAINGGTSYTYQTGGHLADFSIKTNSVAANSDGISFRSVWNCDVERVSVKGLARYGFQVFSLVAPGDPDSSAYINFRNCRSDSNGYGFRLTSASTSIGVTNITIEDCSISQNTDTGVSMSNVSVINIISNGITANPGGGVTLLPVSIGNQFIYVNENEFGNGNTAHNCWLGGAVSGSFNGNRIVQNAGETGEYGLILGDGTNLATNFEAKGNIFRIDSSINPFTAFWVKANTADIRIVDTFYPSFGATGQVKYLLANGEVYLREDGQSWNDCVKQYDVEPTTSYTPDMNTGEEHRIKLNTTGAFTINNPTNVANGKLLKLQIINATGSTVTVSFGTAFVKGGYTDPTNGNRSTAQFIYDGTSSKWIQIGAWANNIS